MRRESINEIRLRMKDGLELRRPVFPRESHGRMRVRVVEVTTPVIRYSQNFFRCRQRKGNWQMDVRVNPVVSVRTWETKTSEHLEVIDDCWSCTPESRHRTVVANLRIIFDSVGSGGVFHCWGRTDRDLSSKSVSPHLGARAWRVLMEVVFSPSALLMFRTVAFAPVPQRLS